MKEARPKVTGGSCTFTVWAPLRRQVDVHIIGPGEKIVPMAQDESGYWTARVDGISHGALYRYRLDDSIERPDPASPCQPEGVHGPSMVVDHKLFRWEMSEPHIALNDYIIYEMHVGTFTEEGTFASAIGKLTQLSDLGVNAVELMPVAQFPGTRNWGYDGVYPFAVQNSYGGPDGLKAFVNECHKLNLAVILDVIYNHLGPEGNYLRDFGPYFTDRYKTPWGESINFDGAYSDAVCDFFISNALQWLLDFHVDALRIDAVHAISDMGARPFLSRLAGAVKQEFYDPAHPKYLIAESDLNDSRIIRSPREGGFGIDAQWSDDFHHSLHTLLTGEKRGYYADFGNMDHMLRTLRNGFCYSGDYSAARKRTHGNDVSDLHTGRFVVCSQNHDQIGNRMLGERLITISDQERARLAASAVILSPYIPLLFMGEEHGEDNPFLYFADHSDVDLKRAVREGRKAEFAEFHGDGQPPDPFDLATFQRSKIDWAKAQTGPHLRMLRFYKELIRLRKTYKAIGPCHRDSLKISRYAESVIVIHYLYPDAPVVCFLNFGSTAQEFGWTADRNLEIVFDSRAFDETHECTHLPETFKQGTICLMLEPYQSAVYIAVSN